MRGAIPPLSRYVFMALCLVMHRDKFTLPYYIRNRIIVPCLAVVLTTHAQSCFPLRNYGGSVAVNSN
jgi:hypothetical protein